MRSEFALQRDGDSSADCFRNSCIVCLAVVLGYVDSLLWPRAISDAILKVSIAFVDVSVGVRACVV